MWDVVCSLLLAVILSLGFFYLYATREHSWTCPACRKRHIHNSILKCPDQLCKGKRPAFATFFPSSALKCSTCDLDEDHEGACCPARRPMSSSDLHAPRPYTSSPPRPYTSPPRPQLERAFLHTNSPPLEGRNLYAIPFFCAQPVMVPQYHPVLPQADQMLRDQIADNIIYKKPQNLEQFAHLRNIMSTNQSSLNNSPVLLAGKRNRSPDSTADLPGTPQLKRLHTSPSSPPSVTLASTSDDRAACLDNLPQRLLRGFELFLTEPQNAGLVPRTLEFLKLSANDLLIQCQNGALASFNTSRPGVYAIPLPSTWPGSRERTVIASQHLCG